MPTDNDIIFQELYRELEAKSNETNCSFHVKKQNTEKFSFLFFSSFLLVSTKFSFWKEDWALGYDSLKF